MKTVLVSGVLAAACGLVLAKLPPPDDAAKAKAAETAAKAAWQGKVDAYQLCKAQDKVVAIYMKNAGKAAPKEAKPAAPCTDPGSFAYTPPQQKPLETAGAHSPTATAASPPSVKQPSAELAPGKKS